MVDDNIFGVPAGWYPDPLGLPQLRWWDSQAWTEHTSEARAPMVPQPASVRTTFAEPEERPAAPSYAVADELPSRREQRERERRETGDVSGDRFPFELDTETEPEQEELSAQPLLAMTLRELEPPPADSVEDAPGPRRASFHANTAPETPLLSALAEEMDEMPEAPERAPRKLRAYTGAVWAIALMPAFQLIISIVLIVVLGQGYNFALLVVVWIAPYFFVFGFAAFDRLLLQTWGHKRTASAAWAILGQPGYLIARAVRTWGETGKGMMPIAFNAASVVTVLAGILILPGLLISVLPGVFAQEVARSVEADGAALGATFTVECPAPPLIIGDTFACIGTTPAGMTDSISVRLTRQSGWIDWRVEDWGPSIMLAN